MTRLDRFNRTIVSLIGLLLLAAGALGQTSGRTVDIDTTLPAG